MKLFRTVFVLAAFLPLFLMGIEAGDGESYGFSIDLPPDWKVQTGTEYSAAFLGAKAPDGTVLRISSAPGTVPLSMILPALKSTLELRCKPKTEILEKQCSFCGMNGSKLVFSTGDGYRVDYFLLPSKERLYTVIFVVPAGKDSEKITGELMKSLKFLKPEELSSADR